MRLGKLIADWRAMNRLGVRDAAKSIGISAATLNRIERGKNCDGRSLAKLMIWLFAESMPAREVAERGQ